MPLVHAFDAARARGRPLPRGGRGEVPRRDGVGPPPLPVLPDARAHRAARRPRRHRRRRLAAVRGALTVGELLAFLTFLSRLYGPVKGSAAPSPRRTPPRPAPSTSSSSSPNRPCRPTAPAPSRSIGRTARSMSRGWVLGTTAARARARGVSFVLRPGEVTASSGRAGPASPRWPGCCCVRSTLVRPGAARRPRPARPDPVLPAPHVAVVLQETLLVDGTVRDNIAYGRPDATEEAIRAAARRRGRPRLRRAAARRLRHPGRRARPAALRRPGPAGRHRAGSAVRRPGAGARRADHRPSTPARRTGSLEPLNRLMEGRSTAGHLAQPDRRPRADARARAGRGAAGRAWPHEELLARGGRPRWQTRGCGSARSSGDAGSRAGHDLTIEPRSSRPREIAPGYIVEELLSGGRPWTSTPCSPRPALQRHGQDHPPGPGRRTSCPRPPPARGPPAHHAEPPPPGARLRGRRGHRSRS